MNETIEQIDALIAELDITLSAEFVPASHFDDEWRRGAVNFNATITRGSARLQTLYAYGVGHLPGYKFNEAKTVYGNEKVSAACESGKWRNAHVPQPELRDVLYSLIMDYSVIDYPTFEQWAPDLGYDPDSRAGEKVYQACMRNALTLRAMLGDADIDRLQTAYQDY